MAIGRVTTYQRLLLQCLVVSWLTVSSLALSVEPRSMTSSWYSLTTNAFLGLFNVATGRATNDAEAHLEEGKTRIVMVSLS